MVGPVELVVLLKATPPVRLTELETLLWKLPVKLVDPVEAVGEIPPVELTALEGFIRMFLLSVPAQAPPPRTSIFATQLETLEVRAFGMWVRVRGSG